MILQNFQTSLIYFAVISSALSAGIFFAFSTFVMRALALQPSASGIATMQSINVTVFNPWFYSAFFGPAVACVLLAVAALRNWEQPGALYLIAGSLLYLIGTLGVTALGNVPLNDALAILRPTSTEGAQLWSKYLIDWTFWNHVRTAAAFLAAAMFTFSLP
ncbi:MAG: anthrone oxygenase family protein [Cyanobacteria bacterium P01_F01_bin.53]